jgi:hypothetical protein
VGIEAAKKKANLLGMYDIDRVVDYIAEKQKSEAADLVDWIQNGNDSSRNKWVIYRVGPYIIFLVFAGLGLISNF